MPRRHSDPNALAHSEATPDQRLERTAKLLGYDAATTQALLHVTVQMQSQCASHMVGGRRQLSLAMFEICDNSCTLLKALQLHTLACCS